MEQTEFEYFVKIRKHLHQHPEVSGDESETAAYIVEQLKSYTPTKIFENVGGTGVLAIFEGKKTGKTVLFRAELDALPIQESNTFSHKSKHENVSHKCGHDGHATTLLALAAKLSAAPIQQGKVLLLFQPAEETGEGARAVLADSSMEAFEPDMVFAFHNLPNYPLNRIVLREASFSAAVKSLIIHLDGKTSHAAEPEHGVNPALALADILQKCSELSNNAPEHTDFAVITPVHIELGTIAYGISAGAGSLRLTIRTWSEQAMDTLCKELMQFLESVTQSYGLGLRTEWTQEFAANQNAPEAIALIRSTAESQGLDVEMRQYPFKWGEDFGLFTQRFRGAMFGIGSGEACPALHNPDYDFPDAIIPVGSALFYGILQSVLDLSVE